MMSSSEQAPCLSILFPKISTGQAEICSSLSKHYIVTQGRGGYTYNTYNMPGLIMSERRESVVPPPPPTAIGPGLPQQCFTTRAVLAHSILS